MRLALPSFSRLRTRVGERVYDTTPPRPIRVVAGGLSWRLRRIARPAPVYLDPRKSGAHDVVVYFAEGKIRLYQLEQWVPVLERLSERHPVLVVTRREDSWRYVQDKTGLDTALAPTFRDLSDLYSQVDPKVALYVNNAGQNFQSLSSSRMLHVHINHGESDKLSMVSNQGKAYDRLFVAGEAAVLRHRAALLEMDETKLIRIGRPQLDLDLPPALPPTERRTVLYAPTWEGENEANNYTSVDLYGAAITTAALATEGVRFVYKPHPRIPTSKTAAMLEEHETICRLLSDAARRDPSAGHVIAGESVNVLALLEQADLLISDVSSVTLDFLYLRTERPLLLTDRRNDRPRLLVDAPISVACDVVDAATTANLPQLVRGALAEDSFSAERERMRQFYFGDLKHGESTDRFLEEIETLVRLRDDGLRQRGTLGMSEATAPEADDDDELTMEDTA